MTWESTEGIVLQATAFQDRHRIIKVFTKNKGLLSFFVKNVSANNPRLVAICSPFCRAEWIFQSSSKDLYKIKDSSVIDANLQLRDRLESLHSGGDILRVILETQLPNKPSANIYALLHSYLRKIPQCKDPSILSISFQLKLATAEGLLHIEPTCSICKKEKACCVADGESFCKNHKPPNTPILDETEFSFLQKLTYSRKFSEIMNVQLTNSSKNKFLHYIDELIKTHH